MCARCSIETREKCTSEEILLWCLTDFKSEEDKIEFKKELLKKRDLCVHGERVHWVQWM